MEVSYSTVRGSLSLIPEQNRGPGDGGGGGSCYLVFDGVELTEEALEAWLRLCTAQVKAAEETWWFSAGPGRVSDAVSLQPPPQTQTKKPEKSKNNLSPQEVQHIHVSVSLYIYPQWKLA